MARTAAKVDQDIDAFESDPGPDPAFAVPPAPLPGLERGGAGLAEALNTGACRKPQRLPTRHTAPPAGSGRLFAGWP
jgi:hypothetical protein